MSTHSRKPIAQAVVDRIRTALAQGVNVSRICERFGVGKMTVYRVMALDAKADAAPPLSDDPRALYRTEKAKRDERLKLTPVLASAEQAFRERLERDKQAGKGGRPKGVKPVNSLAGQLAKPGKPRMELSRSTDLAECLGPFYGVGS